MKREAIEQALLEWMRSKSPVADDARFQTLALALFAHQFEHCGAYARFCAGRGVLPDTIKGWQEIPAVPTGAFKELTLTSFPAQESQHVFRTSGTSTATRGELHLDTLELYEASLLASFRHALFPDLDDDTKARILVLAPSRQAVPDSSLSHMFGSAIERFGDTESHHFVRDGALETARLRQAIERIPTDRPVLVCGTAFSFVHWLDALTDADTRLKLPANVRIMETGGYKGRARERSQDELYAEIEAILGVPAQRIVNQYGMTELGSQFYDSVLVDPAGPRRKLTPAWTRVRFDDPRTGHEVAPDQFGTIRILDLANTGSVCAIQTADLGRSIGTGFEVAGRELGAEERGCSIAADLLLGDAT